MEPNRMNRIGLAIIASLSLGTAACVGSVPTNSLDDDDGPPVDAACPTSISGKVFAPNGTLPLYGVTVYVPMSTPGPLVEGVTCGQCANELSGGVLTRATSDAQGNFRLEGVPPGTNIPVVLTTGKWRRQVTVASVAQCQNTAVADGTFRLPKNRAEGDMPRIAMVTGGCDPLACILNKLGIDPTEFGSSVNEPKRVVFYNGSGGQAPGAPQSAQALWSNLAELKKFDMVINSCECSEHNENKTAPDALRQYADLGGRIFGSHYHYTWAKSLIPQWQSTAAWSSTGMERSALDPDLVDTSFAEGSVLADWLLAVGASTVKGQIALGQKTGDVSTVNAPTKRWLYSSSSAPAAETTHYLSFNTPVGAPAQNQCGKVVYAGMHVASGAVTQSFPSGCSAEFTPDEKALVFLLFDLGSCVETIL